MRVEKGINPNCSEIIVRLGDKKDYKKIIKKLEKIGIEIDFDDRYDDIETALHYNSDICLGDDISLTEYHDGKLSAMADEFERDSFPRMREIAELFNQDVEGYDGGHADTYEDWLEETVEGEGDE